MTRASRIGALAAVTACVVILSCVRGDNSPLSQEPGVRTGLDVLCEQGYGLLKGKRVGLVCNHSAVNGRGKHVISLFSSQNVFQLVALFSPEHGLTGDVDKPIPSGVDAASGLKVYSLYGQTLRPTPESLEGIDTLVFDMQDVGARFYTYISTMAMCMEEAAKHNIGFVVLDRPNPITGTRVGGPLPDRAYLGRFISYFSLPVMHGMTVGELARMFKEEFGIRCNLTVVKMRGWRRAMWFDESGLPWINPSPNIRNLVAAILYPGFGIVEATNMSVGRGTFAPFELYGAPWMNGNKLAEEMNQRGLRGLQFVPAEFTPDASVFAGEKCSGVRVVLTERSKFESLRAGLTFIDAICRLHGDVFEIEKISPMIGDGSVAEKIKTGVAVEAILRGWRSQQRDFLARRKKYLLYP